MHTIFERLRALTPDERVLLALVAAAFLSIYAIAAALLALPFYLIITKKIVPVLRASRGAPLLGLFCAISLGVTIRYGDTRAVALGVGMLFAAVALLFVQYAMTRRAFRLMLTISCAGSLLAFFVALAQRLWLTQYLFQGRACATFVNANFYATVIEVTTLFAVYRLLRRGSVARTVFYVAVLCANLGGLYLCQSRAAFLVVFGSVALLLALTDLRYLGHACAVLLIMLLLYSARGVWMPRLDEAGSDLAAGREQIWRTAGRMIRDHLLYGRGYLSYQQFYRAYHGFAANHAHNLLLDLLVNFGVVGAGLLLAYLAVNLAGIVRIYLCGAERSKSALALAVLATVLVHGVVDATVYWPQTALLVVTVLTYSRAYSDMPAVSERAPLRARGAKTKQTTVQP